MRVRFSWFGASGLPVEVFGGQTWWLQCRLYGPSVLTIRARTRPDPRSGRAGWLAQAVPFLGMANPVPQERP
jgi:hypothetical protein